MISLSARVQLDICEEHGLHPFEVYDRDTSIVFVQGDQKQTAPSAAELV